MPGALPRAPTCMQRFVEWDTLELRINGEKLNVFLATMRVDPVERIELQFFNGLMRVIGSIRKFISVPFSIDIREIIASGRTVRVPLGAASAFGAIPIPQFLFGLVRNRLPAELVRYEDPATLVFSLDRLWPGMSGSSGMGARLISHRGKCGRPDKTKAGGCTSFRKRRMLQ